MDFTSLRLNIFKKCQAAVHKIIINAARNRLWYLLGGILVVVVIVLYSQSSGYTTKNVKWTPVLKGNFVMDITVCGEARAVNAYNVPAPMEWRTELQITDMVTEGTYVQKSDFLVQFDTSALDDVLDTAIDQLKAQEAELLSVQTKQKSQMARLESDLKMSEYSRETAELQLELLKYESEVRKEDARLAYQKALISYDETETKIRTQKIINEAELGNVLQTLRYRQNNVKDLSKRIDQLTLRAPIPGMVVYNEIGGWMGTPRHKVSIGETVWANMTVIRIPDLSAMESVVRISEIDALKITLGDRALLRLDAFEERLFQGRVVNIAPLADRADLGEESQIMEYEVIIRFDETDEIIKPGMSTKTRIILEEIPDVLFVPMGAVFENNSETLVFPKKKYPQPVTVKLEKRNNRFIIVEGDIKKGDEIALSPPVEDAHPLGWLAEMERKKLENEELVAHLDTMQEEGIVKKIEENISKTSPQIPDQFKRIAEILERTAYPLTEEQIEKLSSAGSGENPQVIISEVLSKEQQNALQTLNNRPMNQQMNRGPR